MEGGREGAYMFDGDRLAGVAINGLEYFAEAAAWAWVSARGVGVGWGCTYCPAPP